MDIDECVNGQSGCQHTCENTPGKFTCSCYYGYALKMDRKTCEPVEDPCSTFANLNCSQICIVNRAEKSSKCSCNQGFELLEDKQTCMDINECVDISLNHCSQRSTCLNTDGDYTCSCSIGFRLENDGRTCTECDQYHYGPNCFIPCDCGIGADRCDPIKGCVCSDGWGGEKCILDKNECTAIPSPCPGENTVCVNTNGSFICTCASGFSNSSSGCEDINECMDPLWNDCVQICVNKEGSYQCGCEQGFLQDGINCRDIDECAGQNDCNHFCENTPGGYRCACEEGFKLNITDKRTCIPAFLCQMQDDLVCKNKGAFCVEKNGGAECYCDKGYVFAKNGTCEDFDECTSNPCNELCTNRPGDYICSCGPGRKIANDAKTCIECPDGQYGDGCHNSCSCNVSNTEKCQKNTGECVCFPGWEGVVCESDINECLKPLSCHLNSTCNNNLGSYTCDCHTGFFQTASGECQECDSKHYGRDCGDECTCVMWNTHSCDKIDGTCTCLNGWTGVSCEEATEISTEPLKKILTSTPGISTISTTAVRENGTKQITTETTGMMTASTKQLTFTKTTLSSDHLVTSSEATSSQTSTSTMTPSVTTNNGILRIACTITLNIELSTSIDLNVGEMYQHYSVTVKEALEAHYQAYLLKSPVTVTIRSIRRGSLIVEHDVIFKNTEETKQHFTNAVTQFIIGQSVIIDGMKATAKEVNVGGTLVSAEGNKEQEMCSIYNALDGGCPDSYTCEVQDDYPSCRKKNTSENVTMVIGICIGTGVLILIGFVLLIVSLQRRKKKQHALRNKRSGRMERDGPIPLTGVPPKNPST